MSLLQPFIDWLQEPGVLESELRERRISARRKLDEMGLSNIREALMRDRLDELKVWLADQTSDIDLIAREAVEGGSLPTFKTTETRYSNEL